MKIYAIGFGEYSDAYIDRVTTSKEKAETFCRLYNAKNNDTPWIDEYEVDDWEIVCDKNFDKTIGYKFHFTYRRGRIDTYTQKGVESYRFSNKVERSTYSDWTHITIWCKENNYEKAQKIAQDEYMKWKYEHIDEL